MDDTPFTPSRRKARVEIIPLIDVVFFLLATFVLFTLSLDKIWSLPVVLPKAGQPIPGMEDQNLYLQATEHGLYRWNVGRDSPPEYIARGELVPRLESYKRAVAAPRVLINGEDRVPFSSTVELLDIVRRVRIKDVSLETTRS